MNNTTMTLVARRCKAFGAAAIAMGAAFLATTTPASATDSGLGFYPTADIYPSGNFHFDYDTFGTGLKTNGATSVGLEYGFGKGTDGLFGRSEIGFDYVVSGFASASPEKRLAFNFKTQLYNDSESGTRIAAGVANVGDKALGRIDGRLLAYKTFGFGRIHAGAWRGFGRSGVSDTGGLQLGFDRAVGKKTIVGIDWRSGPTGVLAPCVIYNINDKAGIEFCVGRANSNVSPRWTTYMAFDYNFDFKKAEPEPAPAPAPKP